MIPPQLWKLPGELSGQPWIISHPLHLSLLISLEYYMKIILCIFVKNAFPDGIRQSQRKKSRPWWAVYPEIGYIPKMFANAILSLSQHTWSAGLPVTGRGWWCWQKPKDSVLGMKNKNENKTKTNLNPFIVNLKEHCDLELSRFVMDKKVDLRKQPLLSKMLCIHWEKYWEWFF